VADTKYILSEKGNCVSIPEAAAKKLVRSGSGSAALVYITILLGGGRIEPEVIASSLKLTAAQVSAALLELNTMGIIKPDGSAAQVSAPEPAPDYTTEDIKNALTSNGTFSDLVSDVQEKFGRKLTTDDLRRLLTICEHYRLTHDYVLLLITYLIDDAKKRGGRVPTMRYVEKVAADWEKDGVATYDDCVRRISQREAQLKAEEEYAAALGIGDRRLTPSERGYVSGFIAMGISPDLVAAAYDRTVLRTGRRSWNYIDTILKSWHAKGIRTVDDIEKKDAVRQARTGSKDSPVRDDTELLRKLMNQIKDD